MFRSCTICIITSIADVKSKKYDTFVCGNGTCARQWTGTGCKKIWFSAFNYYYCADADLLAKLFMALLLEAMAATHQYNKLISSHINK